MTLSEQIFVERGQVAAHPNNQPRVGREFRARIFWLGKEPLVPNKTYRLRLLTQNVDAVIAKIVKVTDASTLESKEADSVPRDSICEVIVRATRNIAFDLGYDTALLRLTGASLAAGLPAGSVLISSMSLIGVKPASRTYVQRSP